MAGRRRRCVAGGTLLVAGGPRSIGGCCTHPCSGRCSDVLSSSAGQRGDAEDTLGSARRRAATGLPRQSRSTIVLHWDVWKVVLSDTAVQELGRIRKGERVRVKDGIRKHLAEGDPLQTTRNKFRLRRPSEYAEYELRLDPWRVFHRVHTEVVEVVLIGEKRGNKLLIGGEEFVL